MKYYEFFAGGGMARAGLGDGWECLLANDNDAAKAECYRRHFNAGEELVVGDVASIKLHDLPGRADLAWASFPCQDLSLAGVKKGLAGARSGAFWPFWRLMEGLVKQNRAPRTIVLENVQGAVTSHGGQDLAAIVKALAKQDYRFSPMVINAALFVPQSRPRLFIIGFHDTTAIPPQLISSAPVDGWSSESLAKVRNGLGPAARARWVWLNPPQPKSRISTLARIIEDDPSGVPWHTPQQTQRLLGMMTGRNREKVEAALRMKTRQVGAVYKRMRVEKDGARRQRAEARFDGLAGCLRTPAGGSSRQIILIVENGQARSRLISPRETARLMGLPEDYQLPTRPNKAYHLTGDGVATPVVRWLAETILEPALMNGAEKLALAPAMAPGAMD